MVSSRRAGPWFCSISISTLQNRPSREWYSIKVGWMNNHPCALVGGPGREEVAVEDWRQEADICTVRRLDPVFSLSLSCKMGASGLAWLGSQVCHEASSERKWHYPG